MLSILQRNQFNVHLFGLASGGNVRSLKFIVNAPTVSHQSATNFTDMKVRTWLVRDVPKSSDH